MNTAAPDPAADALVFEGLCKTYKPGKPGEVQALKGLNLRVRRGDFFALLGNNGAGKSTAIGVVAGLVRKTGGKVQVMGLDIDSHHASARKHIGLVPQEFNFSQFEKVYDIVVTCAGYFGLKPAQARANTEKYLRQLSLWDKRKEVARNLSGGMKRRLMIARALVHEPSLLILDEPTAGVDVQMRHETWDFLQAINKKGTTIVLTTHYLEEVQTLCHNLAIIDGGHITTSGSVHDVLASAKVHRLILETNTPLTELPKLPKSFKAHLDEVDADLLHVYYHPQEGSLYSLIGALEEQDIKVIGMREENSRLEELFLHPEEEAKDERGLLTNESG